MFIKNRVRGFNKPYQYILTFAFICCFIWFFNYISKTGNKHQKEKHLKEAYTKAFTGVVKNKYLKRFNVVEIQTDSTLKKLIGYSFANLVDIGDSVIKVKGENRITIKNGRKVMNVIYYP